ncbi:hypothetical protein EDB89DRAFT_2078312 [Lactarius sanguifluus]|nr:hypothetical protein EDB89DRAFT_2078312 [Lactarius sanguifluus]
MQFGLICTLYHPQKRNLTHHIRDLMSHVNFALHENTRELHAYTREQKKKEARGEGNGFDGELDNFQEPKLSSLAKLNMDEIFDL